MATNMEGNRKKEQPNRLRKKPTITFRSDLSPGALAYIKKLSEIKAKSQFINRAVDMRFLYITNKKWFVRQVLKENYNLARYLLRKIGNEK
ncbi:MAG: hypothetical protein ABIH59_02865 [archaeon]